MATTVLGLKTFTASDPVDYNEINDNYNKIDTGVKTALQGRAAHNLLDNSDFRNPVNQRGQTSYNTTWAYSIDRWYVPGNAGVVVNDGSVSFMTLDQFVGSSVKSGIYTAAICLSDGTVHVGSASFSGTSDVVLIHNSTMDSYLQSSTASNGHPRLRVQTNTDSALTAIWAALYEGSYDASTLPAYQPKGYAAELAECQRYARIRNVDNYAIATLGAEKVFTIEHPGMRITPTVQVINPITNAVGSIASYSAGGEFPAVIMSTTKDRTNIKVESGTPGNTYMYAYNINADL